MDYKIYPPDGILDGTAALPLSKSMSNRALAINAISQGLVRHTTLSDCSDTQVMTMALQTGDEAIRSIDINDCGTAMRFLTAVFASRPSTTTILTGSARMQERPIGPLVDALRQCGASISYLGQEGYPPIKIEGKPLVGGELEIDATISSQFVSALIMAAPIMQQGLKVNLIGEPSSLPYIDLTIAMMQQAGAAVEREGETIRVEPSPYKSSTLEIEGDWSAASFVYEIAALTGGFVTLSPLNINSRQPDRRTIEAFNLMGVETATSEEAADALDLCGSPDVAPRLNIDLCATPDMAPSLAVTCAMIGVPFNISGLQSLAIKESNRLEALKEELQKLGVFVSINGGDTLLWDGTRMPILELPQFDSHGDHRLAMALAPVACYIPGIVVKDVQVVDKSFPNYWQMLQNIGFSIEDAAIEPNPTETE